MAAKAGFERGASPSTHFSQAPKERMPEFEETPAGGRLVIATARAALGQPVEMLKRRIGVAAWLGLTPPRSRGGQPPPARRPPSPSSHPEHSRESKYSRPFNQVDPLHRLPRALNKPY
ncbi:MAG: hypothetical protein WBF43_09390 [Methylocella sp.]